jgi:predicted transposase/invertase (TIGR01784 family)
VLKLAWQLEGGKRIMGKTESMKRGEGEMYKSVFERVYTAKGMEKGMEKGIAQGRTEGRTEVARNMLRKGLSIDSVVEYTDLPRREVESLAG